MNIKYYALALAFVTSFSMHAAAADESGFTTPEPGQKANNVKEIKQATEVEYLILFSKMIAINKSIVGATPGRKTLLIAERATLMKTAESIASILGNRKWLNDLEKFPRRN